MKITAKHLLIGGGVLLAITSIFGGRKALRVHNVAKQLQFQLRGVTKFPKFRGALAESAINLAIINPTGIPLDVNTGGLVTLKRVRIYNREGRLTAVATPNLSNISIPALGETLLRNVTIESNVLNLLNTLLLASTDPRDYTVESDIEVVGQTFTL